MVIVETVMRTTFLFVVGNYCLLVGFDLFFLGTFEYMMDNDNYKEQNCFIDFYWPANFPPELTSKEVDFVRNSPDKCFLKRFGSSTHARGVSKSMNSYFNSNQSWTGLEFLNAVKDGIERLSQFCPRYLVVSLGKIVVKCCCCCFTIFLVVVGFDSHRDDPLKIGKLIDEDFLFFFKTITEWLRSHENVKLVVVVEGGYNAEVAERLFPQILQILYSFARSAP
jgi:hypothetical protein